ncbi:hypothetical protein pb186bvf_014287 [Paramecium bursaria]
MDHIGLTDITHQKARLFVQKMTSLFILQQSYQCFLNIKIGHKMNQDKIFFYRQSKQITEYVQVERYFQEWQIELDAARQALSSRGCVQKLFNMNNQAQRIRTAVSKVQEYKDKKYNLLKELTIRKIIQKKTEQLIKDNYKNQQYRRGESYKNQGNQQNKQNLLQKEKQQNNYDKNLSSNRLKNKNDTQQNIRVTYDKTIQKKNELKQQEELLKWLNSNLQNTENQYQNIIRIIEQEQSNPHQLLIVTT